MLEGPCGRLLDVICLDFEFFSREMMLLQVFAADITKVNQSYSELVSISLASFVLKSVLAN